MTIVTKRYKQQCHRFLKVLVQNTEILDKLRDKSIELKLDVQSAYLSSMISDNYTAIKHLAIELDRMKKSLESKS